MNQEYFSETLAKLLTFVIRVGLLMFLWNEYITEQIISYRKMSFLDMAVVTLFIGILFMQEKDIKKNKGDFL
jgi:hypothetical protein